MADRTSCAACGGTGTCPRCGGSGGGESATTQCPLCRGVGDCPQCEGEGTVPEEPNGPQRPGP